MICYCGGNFIMTDNMKDNPDKDSDSLNEKIYLKDVVIESLGDKLDEMTQLNNILKERIYELNRALMETDDDNPLNNMEYWKGIERTYEKLISEYIDKVTAKEIEIFGLEERNEYFKNQTGTNDK